MIFMARIQSESWLKAYAQNDDDYGVRLLSLQTLVNRYANHTQTWELVSDRA